MSFFNLTRLGLQDPIKAAVTRPGTTPAPKDQCDTAKSTAGAQRTTLSEPVYPNSEANGSYVKYTERLHKHIRPKMGKIFLLTAKLHFYLMLRVFARYLHFVNSDLELLIAARKLFTFADIVFLCFATINDKLYMLSRR